MKVRLKEEEIKALKEVIHSFDPSAEIILFRKQDQLGEKGR